MTETCVFRRLGRDGKLSLLGESRQGFMVKMHVYGRGLTQCVCAS